jgi:hypothetical protein
MFLGSCVHPKAAITALLMIPFYGAPFIPEIFLATIVTQAMERI